MNLLMMNCGLYLIRGQLPVNVCKNPLTSRKIERNRPAGGQERHCGALEKGVKPEATCGDPPEARGIR